MREATTSAGLGTGSLCKGHIMLSEIAPIAPYAIALLAFSLAGTVIVAAFIELPPPARMPRPAIVVAGSWFAAFLAAAVLRHPFHDFLVTALLIAAAELAGAAAIWLSRGHEQRDDGHGHPPPDPPPPATLPDEYWQRWEDQFRPEHSEPLKAVLPTQR